MNLTVVKYEFGTIRFFKIFHFHSFLLLVHFHICCYGWAILSKKSIWRWMALMCFIPCKKYKNWSLFWNWSGFNCPHFYVLNKLKEDNETLLDHTLKGLIKFYFMLAFMNKNDEEYLQTSNNCDKFIKYFIICIIFVKSNIFNFHSSES